MTKSDNNIGNPWHDEEGKFTSPDAATLGVSVEDFLSYKNGFNIQLKSLDELNQILDEAIQLKDLNELNSILDDFLAKNSLADLKFSKNVDEVKDNVIKVLENPAYIKGLAENINFGASNMYRKTSHKYYSVGRYNNAYNNPIIYELVYSRFPNKAKIISQQEYKAKIALIKSQGSGQLNNGYVYSRSSEAMYDNIDRPDLRDLGCGLIRVFRGIGVSDVTSDEARELRLMYSEKGTMNPIVSDHSGNSGSTHYFSMQSSYSDDYASTPELIINGIVNLTGENANANIITKDQLINLKSRLTRDLNRDDNFIQQMKQTIKNSLINGGYDDVDNKSEELYSCFMDTLLNDKGLTALLCGAQAEVAEPHNGSQFNLYDLSLLEMLE